MDVKRTRNVLDTERMPRGGDSEKITINLGYVDLGRIDLMVHDGFYSNRSDFIRTAIRNQLASHAPEVTRAIERHTVELGLRDFDAADLEQLRERGEVLHLRVLGLARIAADVTPELALATLASVTVFGALQASPAVKAALAGRIR
jgi:Arc/MetJ-type ribon-helix-helix transcriptional regulator